MLRKPSKPPKKTSAAGKTGSAKSGAAKPGKPASKAVSAPEKAAPAKARLAAGKSPAPKKSASARSTTGAWHTRPAPSNPGMESRLSLDSKLDIVGVVLALGGVLSLLSLLSVSQGSITQEWDALLSKAFGWGKYIFPVGMLGAGLWLVLRNFERIPMLSLERLAGISLLYLDLLGIFHWIILLQNDLPPMDSAAAGLGGGYIGGIILMALLSALGRAGAAIALFAWFLIALALTLDRTILELFSWVGPVFSRAWAQAMKGWQQRAGTARSADSLPFDATNPYPELTPRQPVPASPAQAHAAQAQNPEGSKQGAPSLEPSLATEARPWVLPPLSEILDAGKEVIHDDEIDRQRAQVIEETLSSFGAPARVVEINRGPTITQFGVEPDFVESRNGRMRVRVGKIAALADDLALALSARTIRIQAPAPGRGFVGIEVPNDEIATVALRDVIESEGFKRIKSPLGFALGQNVAGMAVSADLAAMPHLLVAGQTGSGKSVCVNALICTLLLNNTPDTLRLLMVDPKRVELTGYNGIPHLLAPVVVEMERVVAALQWVTREMDMRYRKLSEMGARNIVDYNARIVQRGGTKLPYLVVIIDELADLMMLAPDETEKTITRLAQLARATGIHLVIATQRPDRKSVV